MRMKKMVKYSALMALVLAMAAGCATSPTEEPMSADEQTADANAEAQAAIDSAKAALKEAEAAGASWEGSSALIAQAEAALAAGDTARAIELANKARRDADAALAQKRAEAVRTAAEQAPADDHYTVARGDSLWVISGKGEIYGNPYQWPLIYKANQDKIEDADLIYPGQDLTITRGASAAEVDAAVSHAKTRGAWSLGVVEESDRAYLNH